MSTQEQIQSLTGELADLRARLAAADAEYDSQLLAREQIQTTIATETDSRTLTTLQRSEARATTTLNTINESRSNLATLIDAAEGQRSTLQANLSQSLTSAQQIASRSGPEMAASFAAAEKINRTSGLVSSGSGQPVVKVVDVPASAYANGFLSNTSSPLVTTTTNLTQTRRANISKAQLNEADRGYTTAMNELSQFWSVNDYESDDYSAAKAKAIAAQRTFELARDGLEEVTVQDRASALADLDFGFVDDLAVDTPLDLLDGDILSGGDLEANGQGDQAGEDIVISGTPVDKRIRLRPLYEGSGDDSFYGGAESVMKILEPTMGVVFPFTPRITMNHQVSYTTMAPVHANTSYHHYNSTPAVEISINGDFSAQNLDEARYTLAAMHFFRSASKMHFGTQDANRGLPPPLLLLSGYGDFMFNDLQVIMTGFNMDLPDDVDYMEVDVAGHSAWVPTLCSMNLTLVVQQTPAAHRDEFDLSKFRSGELINTSKGWI